MTDVNQILKQRGAAYGDYHEGVILRSSIMWKLDQLHRSENGCPLDAVHYGYLWDIVNKLCRIATTPTHLDSWVDVIGYATLIKNQLIKERPEDAPK